MSDLFPDPAPDFSDPLGMIRACHQRMLQHCALLEKLAEHLKHSGADDDARAAAQKARRYFSTSAVFHHQDEEQDLFPRLGRSSIRMAEVVHRLRQDHQKLDSAWDAIGPMLANVQHIGDHARFAALVAEFCQGYREHIRIEEQDFLDRAQHMLSSDDLNKIGLRYCNPVIPHGETDARDMDEFDDVEERVAAT